MVLTMKGNAMYAILFSLLLSLLAGPALAFGWVDCHNTANPKGLATRGSVCGLPTGTGSSAGLDVTSALLDIQNCENVDVLYDDDTADTAGAADCSIYNCLVDTASTNHCNLVEGAALTGQHPLDVFYGLGGSWIYAVCTDPGATETPIIQVKCNP